jgi:hypothetical protein
MMGRLMGENLMRTVLALVVWCAIASGLSVSTHESIGALAPTVTATAVAQQPSLDVDVDINKGDNRAWYASPVWVAIGGLAVMLMIVLLILAFRGGGTTVVKD